MLLAVLPGAAARELAISGLNVGVAAMRSPHGVTVFVPRHGAAGHRANCL